jgi:hypothetical protein
MEPFLNPEATLWASRVRLARTDASLQELSEAIRKTFDRIHCTREQIQRTNQILSAIDASWAADGQNCPTPNPSQDTQNNKTTDSTQRDNELDRPDLLWFSNIEQSSIFNPPPRESPGHSQTLSRSVPQGGPQEGLFRS